MFAVNFLVGAVGPEARVARLSLAHLEPARPPVAEMYHKLGRPKSWACSREAGRRSELRCGV